MRTDGLSIPFSEIAIISGVSKRTIFHDQRSPVQCQKVSRHLSIALDAWDAVGRFVFDRFEAGCPAGTNDTLKFLRSEFGLYVCVDTPRK
jgi:hypothetical protein